jgi:hypothetical protein
MKPVSSIRAWNLGLVSYGATSQYRESSGAGSFRAQYGLDKSVNVKWRNKTDARTENGLRQPGRRVPVLINSEFKTHPNNSSVFAITPAQFRSRKPVAVASGGSTIFRS